MNVQEINESGHSVWAFVVCAVAVWMITGGMWMAWQVRQNFKVAKHRAVASAPWFSAEGTRYQTAYIRREYSKIGGRLTRPFHYLRLRRLEKSGRSAA